MKALSSLVGLCILVLTLGCASTTPVEHEVYFDYDVNFDFAKSKTYDWRTYPATLQVDQFARIRIEDAVNQQLATKGLRLSPNSPDLYVVMYEGKIKNFNLAALKVDYEVYEVGRLKLVFFDARSGREIWWGETRADLFYQGTPEAYQRTPEQKDKVINFAVARILEYYPPKD
jgi:hypothetical protein